MGSEKEKIRAYALLLQKQSISQNEANDVRFGKVEK